MINRTIISQVLGFFLYSLAQVLFFKDMVLFDRGFCYIYIAFLLLLPVELAVLFQMIMGFLVGATIDIFYDSMGMHASACVLIMYLRTYWLNLLTPQGGYDPGAVPVMKLNGWNWFMAYSLPLIFVHHTLLFYIEAGGLQWFGFTLSKVLLSTGFTFLVLLLTQYFFYMPRTR